MEEKFNIETSSTYKYKYKYTNINNTSYKLIVYLNMIIYFINMNR